LKLVPGTTVNTVERCSGHAGTYGVKKQHHETAMKIGKPVFKAMMQGPAGPPKYISSDCQLSGHHIAQGIEALKLAVGVAPELAHPISLIAKAYGVGR
jgi:glycerol-3-phosphate dehydrogenase subunit C